jgi:hypothetical protein
MPKIRVHVQKMRVYAQAELETARTNLLNAAKALFAAEKSIFPTGFANDPNYAGYSLKTQELIAAADQIYFSIADQQPISQDELLPLIQSIDARSAFRELEQLQGAIPNIAPLMQAVRDFFQATKAMNNALSQPAEQPASVQQG